jgi:DNA transformation protein and related proteins
MSASREFIEFVSEQMAGFGPVSVRRMFSGAGVYRDGLIFALIARDVLYLKTDEESRAPFEAEGLGPFTFSTKTGEHKLTSYWRAPSRCFDDPDEMALWCRRAYDVALKAEKAKAGKKKVKASRPR